MQLVEAVNYLRSNILDDTGGLSVDWEGYEVNDTESFQMRWTNEELTAAINEALNQVYRRILPVKEMNPLFDITTNIGVQSYPLDKRILQVEGIRSATTGRTLYIADIKDVWNNTFAYSDKGTPDRVVLDYDTGTISFFKIPSVSDTYRLLVYRLPLKSLSWEDNEDEIELRQEFVIPMLDYAAYIAYNKDEANTLDPQRSLFFYQRFNQEFPQTSAYSDVRKRRTTNRSVRYGGI
jgi:hypothetical protein